jgi:thiamine-monophosphate kinase
MTRARASRTVHSELALIEAIRRRAAANPGSRGLRLGIGDDCAVLRPSPGHEIVVTTDFSLEDRHFRRAWHPPQSAGHRCLARGLSDLAAMGAEPVAIFLSLAVPARLPAAWVEGFLDGLLALAARHRVPLAGGDTAQSPGLGPGKAGLVDSDIVAIGRVRTGKALLRSGARAGDGLYVTGALGGAAAELLSLAAKPRKFRGFRIAAPGHPHLYPEPRLAVGRSIRNLAHSAIDVSDGLSTDLTHLCAASGLQAEIERAAIPIHPLAAEAERQGLARSALELALHGGEDYELLFTAARAAKVPDRIAGVPVHRIGTMVGTLRKTHSSTPSIVIRNAAGGRTPLEPAGWEHFR